MKNQQPCERYANEEQERADNLLQRITEIKDNPAFTTELWQAGYHDASANAAAHTEQPREWRR
ncbi:hypothetical protein GCM10027160_23760 [Streptomyces calidiresistens]|uniref:Uncharacterized protein n=1 Tax=Streptomyces calidiresistens TaxID=1485586 RepID=A0A7W3T5M4_9ACTN|nr:hypothetical protein [Streptomyces calidiresistens]MBB0231362.1 hypothetical protein [Streptomyces calidiresistens]